MNIRQITLCKVSYKKVSQYFRSLFTGNFWNKCTVVCNCASPHKLGWGRTFVHKFNTRRIISFYHQPQHGKTKSQWMYLHPTEGSFKATEVFLQTLI